MPLAERFRFGDEDTWKRCAGELNKLLASAERPSPADARECLERVSRKSARNASPHLGPPIKRVQFKDYRLSARAELGGFVDLLEGDGNGKDVMAAMEQAGYRGCVSLENS